MLLQTTCGKAVLSSSTVVLQGSDEDPIHTPREPGHMEGRLPHEANKDYQGPLASIRVYLALIRPSTPPLLYEISELSVETHIN